MAGRRASRDAISREQWAGRIAAAAPAPGGARAPRRAGDPLSAERIVDAALAIVETSGFDDLTMRAVAAALDTGPASLYAHVRSKAELGDLLIGRLSAGIRIPPPDPERWREQFADVCAQLRDRFLRYPGVARAALAVVPADLATLKVADGMLGILLAGGVPARSAAWVTDAAVLYITAYCLEAAIAVQQSRDVDGEAISRDEISERLRMLPGADFPNTVALAEELTSGTGHERFEFTLGTMLRGLG